MKLQNKYIEEEMTLAEFSERFLGNNDFKTPVEYDMTGFEIEVETPTGFKPIKSFLVKEGVGEYYTDGKLNGTSNHRIFEGDVEVCLKDHPDFKCITEKMDVVDIEVDGGNYIANGRLNHNTTSGGKALAFHSSLRLRLQAIGQLKNDKKEVIGFKTSCKVIKNRLGPPMRKCEFDIFFSRGMDNYGNWLDTLKERNIIKKAMTAEQKKKASEDDLNRLISIDTTGTKFMFDCSDGNIYEFSKSTFTQLLNKNETLRNDLYNQLCEIHIMQYDDQSKCEPENIEFSEGEIED